MLLTNFRTQPSFVEISYFMLFFSFFYMVSAVGFRKVNKVILL